MCMFLCFVVCPFIATDLHCCDYGMLFCYLFPHINRSTIAVIWYVALLFVPSYQQIYIAVVWYIVFVVFSSILTDLIAKNIWKKWTIKFIMYVTLLKLFENHDNTYNIWFCHMLYVLLYGMLFCCMLFHINSSLLLTERHWSQDMAFLVPVMLDDGYISCVIFINSIPFVLIAGLCQRNLLP